MSSLAGGLCVGLPSLSWDGLNGVATVVTVLGFFLGDFTAILRRGGAVGRAVREGEVERSWSVNEPSHCSVLVNEQLVLGLRWCAGLASPPSSSSSSSSSSFQLYICCSDPGTQRSPSRATQVANALAQRGLRTAPLRSSGDSSAVIEQRLDEAACVVVLLSVAYARQVGQPESGCAQEWRAVCSGRQQQQGVLAVYVDDAELVRQRLPPAWKRKMKQVGGGGGQGREVRLGFDWGEHGLFQEKMDTLAEMIKRVSGKAD